MDKGGPDPGQSCAQLFFTVLQFYSFTLNIKCFIKTPNYSIQYSGSLFFPAKYCAEFVSEFLSLSFRLWGRVHRCTNRRSYPLPKLPIEPGFSNTGLAITAINMKIISGYPHFNLSVPCGYHGYSCLTPSHNIFACGCYFVSLPQYLCSPYLPFLLLESVVLSSLSFNGLRNAMQIS